MNNFWCDSQLWPIAFGFSSAEQSRAIFERIDASPHIFEGVPTRWCAPVSQKVLDHQTKEFASRVSNFEGEHLRPYSWFGRLGAGDILARCQTGQAEHAYRLLNRYCRIVVKEGTCPECLDMEGNRQTGTGGEGDYLEHAGGLILAAVRGIFGIDDTRDGSLRWQPRFPEQLSEMSARYWHLGNCWEFSYKDGKYLIDPHGGAGTVTFTLNGKTEAFEVTKPIKI